MGGLEVFQAPAVDQRRCALYRHFDEHDVLLYVGITEALGDRTNSGHARSSDWVQFAVRAEAEWLDSRTAASRAEREAVKGEKPIFNRQYADWDVDRCIKDYLHGRELQALNDVLGAYQVATLAMLDALPPDDLREASSRARHDYHCAELPIDRQLDAWVLRHAAGIFRARTAEIEEEATLAAYAAVAGFLGEQVEEIRRWKAAAEEAPF